MVLLSLLTTAFRVARLYLEAHGIKDTYLKVETGLAFYDHFWESYIFMHFICLGDHQVPLRLKRKGTGVQSLIGEVAST